MLAQVALAWKLVAEFRQGDEAGSMFPALEEAAVRTKRKTVEGIWFVAPQPAPQHQVLAALNHMERVDLHAANLVNDMVEIINGGRGFASVGGMQVL
jgi:hypothetical protein